MIIVTSNALEKIRTLPSRSIHIFVEQGGCAEYKYRFTSIPNMTGSYEIVNLSVDNINIVIKKVDLSKLSDVEIDFESSLIGSRFVIKSNPKAIDKCKCGISFRSKDD